jgi:two-component system, NtrC family, response regulator PilR
MGELQQVRVLIVDDEEFMRKLMTNILCKAGMEVLTAQNGEEALKTLRETGCDVVVSDVRMAGMSGFELLKQVKTRHPNTAFVVMTGYADSYSIKDALLQGADEYITKPFKNHEVTLIVERAYWRIQSNRKQTESM